MDSDQQVTNEDIKELALALGAGAQDQPILNTHNSAVWDAINELRDLINQMEQSIKKGKK